MKEKGFQQIFLVLLVTLLMTLPSVSSAEWTIETVDNLSVVGSLGQNSSIAVDSNRKVHISYYDSTNDDLKYATNASGLWVTTTIDSTYDVGKYSSIAIDSNNRVHISYYGNYLKYATNASGVWTISTVDTSFVAGEYTSIAIDSSNKVHISYTAFRGVKYATNVSGTWVFTTFDSDKYCKYTSIAVDSNDRAHISYYSYPENLKYVTNASGSWVSSIIDDCESPSIAIDTNNNVHISCYKPGAGAYAPGPLKYITNATNASGSWVTITIDSGYIYDSSIIIDSRNKAHISYFDDTNQDLKYATNAPGAWVTSTIDSAGTVGFYPSVVIDSSDTIHTSYYDFTNKTLKYARNTLSDPPDMDNDGDGYTEIQGDCNDNNDSVYPGALEVCDGIDNNCDGQTDEGLEFNAYYLDHDGDGYGNPFVTTSVCLPPVGYVTDNTDCDDENASANPGAAEVCDLVDNDCNGQIDEGFALYTYYRDLDEDAYGNPSDLLQRCTQPPGYAANDADCDDSNASINPAAVELCDFVDNNCDGQIDEGFTWNTYYRDYDRDGHGTYVMPILACTMPDGYSANNADCNDSNAAIHTGAAEICDGMDNNCSGIIDEGFADADGDGYNICTDCNDSDPSVNPGQREIPFNSKDDDCNPGTSDLWKLETVDAPKKFESTSKAVVIDHLDHPHVVYGGDHLYYAFFDGAQWQYETIDGSSNVGAAANIAVDSNNKLHISYYDALNKDLKYATNVTGSWALRAGLEKLDRDISGKAALN
ncbi:MAG: hypothetical protein C4560_10850 [Nitrospiraceae bacterium]|nr:MAG: hypothetical protein C4560_10850 [Nitrospiraceae bacterium]